MPFASSILPFLKDLQISGKIPKTIEVMHPYKDEYTFSLCTEFYTKYYNNDNKRTLLLGINPGRFGSGTTGISFTDPIKLEQICGIQNTLNKKPELSSDFIYSMIQAYGGPSPFYNRYFISAVSPLGFTKGGKNINYYDDRKLEEAVTPFVIDSINRLMRIGLGKEVCYCIGEGKNFEFLSKLNSSHGWFDEIIPLAHPRFIMQYKRKHVDSYIRDYVMKFRLNEGD